MYGATRQVPVDHVFPWHGIYTSHVCHTCNMCEFISMGFPCNIHVCTHTCIYGTGI